ncbi:hypothetical protein CBS133816_9026 [Aspergillus niger]|nr:hypothetical protein CBS133816_9026 [Aspergillus niger]
MQKNTLTGVVPPAEMKGSRSPSRKMKTYPRSCVIRARFYRALEKAQHESQRLEQALWSQNHAGSMHQIWSLLYVFIAYVGIVMELEYQALPTICFKPARSAFSMVANSPGGLDVLATAVQAAALTGSDIALWKAMLTSVEANKKR